MKHYDEKTRELIADLYYIVEYAKTLREELLNEKNPTLGFSERLVELSQKVYSKLKEN